MNGRIGQPDIQQFAGQGHQPSARLESLSARWIR